MSPTGSSITTEGVVGINCPEGSRGDVHIEETTGSTHKHTKIVLYNVALLVTILKEVCMTKNIKGYILLHQQIVHGMHSHSSVEGVVNATPSNIRPTDIPIQVEMDWVPA